MNTWKVILATLVIFAAGVLTGGALTWRLERANFVRRQRAVRPAQPFSPGGLRFEFLRRAERELELSPVQRERIDQLLKESQERTHRLMEPVTPQLREELQRAKEEFRNVLTPEQRQKFDELIKKQPHARDPRRAQSPSAERASESLTLTNSP